MLRNPWTSPSGSGQTQPLGHDNGKRGDYLKLHHLTPIPSVPTLAVQKSVALAHRHRTDWEAITSVRPIQNGRTSLKFSLVRFSVAVPDARVFEALSGIPKPRSAVESFSPITTLHSFNRGKLGEESPG